MAGAAVGPFWKKSPWIRIACPPKGASLKVAPTVAAVPDVSFIRSLMWERKCAGTWDISSIASPPAMHPCLPPLRHHTSSNLVRNAFNDTTLPPAPSSGGTRLRPASVIVMSNRL